MSEARPGPWLAALTLLPLLALLAAEERARLVVPVLLALAGLLAAVAGWPRLGARGWRLLSLAALGLFLAELFVRGESSLFAGVHLLLYLLVNKAHHRDTTRDLEQLMLVSFLLLLALSVLAVEAVVLLVFLAYALVALRVLELLHRRREREARGEPLAYALPVLGRRSLLRAWLLVAGLGGILFVAFPRVGQGTYQAQLIRPQHVSGFSAEVNLDDLGRIKENDSLVARVRPSSDSGRRLELLRAVVFRDFDGNRWRRDPSPAGLLTRGALADRYVLSRPRPRARLDWFELSVEPLSPLVVLLPERPTLLRGSGLFFAQVDGAGSVALPERRRLRERLNYEAAADLEPIRGASLQVELSDPPPPAGYTDLPAVDPRIRQLAASVASPEATRAQLVEAVLRQFRSGFRYSLELADVPDPIAHFLFESRAGHCELYASAMAVLLRARAVPTRVVNGFRVSEWNALGGYWIVRQADAHAWVEVHYPNAGWVPYDPTPPDPERQRWAFGLRSLSHLLDVTLARWDRWVISFSLGDQLAIFDRLKELAAAIPARLAGTGGLTAGAALLAALLAAGGWWLRRRRRLRGEPVPEIVRIYGQLRRRLDAGGEVLEASLGPAALRARLAADPAAAAVIDLYIRERFAGEPAGAEELRAARAQLRLLRQHRRRGRPVFPLC